MKKKKVISKEKHFKNWLKENSPFHGVIGRRDLFNENGYWSGEREELFVILDENLQVIFEHEPWDKGEYHPNVKAKLEELNITKSRIRTDSSIECMISNMLTSASLEWFSWSFDATQEEKDSYEIEDSSKEWENLELVDGAYGFRTRINEERKNKFNETIKYEGFTDKGKKRIECCIQWYKDNNSKTPMQDAWFKVLKKDGIITGNPHIFGIEELIMQPIDYRSMDVIESEQNERFKKIDKILKK